MNNDTPRSTSPVRKRAVLIAVKDGPGSSSSQLSGPFKDVDEVKTLLLACGFLEKDILVLWNHECSEDSASAPTHQNIINAMEWLVDGAQPGDRLCFHFSGHTAEIVMPNTSRTGKSDCDYALLSSDGAFIRSDDLKSYLIDPLPAGVFLTAILDTCYSTSLLVLPHDKCNQVWGPWNSKGPRRTATLFGYQVRRNAIDVNVRLSGDVFTTRNTAGTKRTASQRLADERKDHHPGSVFQEFDKRSVIFGTMRSFDVSYDPLSQSRKVAARTKSLPLGVDLVTKVHKRVKGDQSRENSQGAAWLSCFDSPTTPVLRSTSPDLYADECDGWCKNKKLCLSDGLGAHVVCIGASKGSQATWEGPDGKSMTQVLTDVVRSFPEASMKEVMTHVSYRIHAHVMGLHDAARDNKKSTTTSTSSIKLEMHNFQDPQVASLRPWNMEERFTYSLL